MFPRELTRYEFSYGASANFAIHPSLARPSSYHLEEITSKNSPVSLPVPEETRARRPSISARWNLCQWYFRFVFAWTADNQRDLSRAAGGRVLFVDFARHRFDRPWSDPKFRTVRKGARWIGTLLRNHRQPPSRRFPGQSLIGSRWLDTWACTPRWVTIIVTNTKKDAREFHLWTVSRFTVFVSFIRSRWSKTTEPRVSGCFSRLAARGKVKRYGPSLHRAFNTLHSTEYLIRIKRSV